MNRALRLGAACALLLFIAWGVRIAAPPGELRDYGSFIASGRAASQGLNPYGIHPLTFHVTLPGFDVWNPNLNPPVSVPAFQVLGMFSAERGLWVWRGFSLLAYLTAVILLVRRYGAGPHGLIALWALALAGLWDTLALGQIYLPLVLAAVGSWLLLERGSPVKAGLLMGIVIAVKPNFAVWPALLLLARHYRLPLVALGTASALSAVPLLMHGAGIYRQWFEVIVRDKERAAFLTNASLPGLAQRASLEPAGTALGIALLAGVAAWAVVRKPPPMRASAVGIVAGILASPIAWVHYTLFLLPVFFSARRSPALIAAAAMLIVPVGAVLQLLDAPLWQQLTAGSIYNWGALLSLAAVTGELATGTDRRARVSARVMPRDGSAIAAPWYPAARQAQAADPLRPLKSE